MGSSDAVVTTIRKGILSGRFRGGTALPSARVLGRLLRVDKNTVSKACGVLAREGLISVAAGRRAVVTARGNGHRARSPELLTQRVSRALLPIVREATLLGVPADELAEIAAEEIRSFYRATQRRVYLVECNRMEAQQYARDLVGMLGLAVEGKLIEELRRLTLADTDVVVVPYYHLDEVAAVLEEGPIVGIHVAPDPAALGKLIEAAQASDERAVLICGNPKSARRFGKLLQFYTARRIRITHVQDTKRVRALVASATTVFATPAAIGADATLARTKPILFTERIDPESLHPLRQILNGSRGRGRRPRAAAVAR
jgi:DNA-binding transcriptional regulator YhcF (GntR family)